jgi:DNA repair exonuclease SbcCD ATPase subunit
MNELSTVQMQLPDTIEDLTQFVLVGKAKLQAYMLKLQTVNKLSVAQEIRDQTLKEAQDISNALIAAEQRIGELLLAIPKATGNQYTSASSPLGEKAKTKSETAAEMGYSRKNVDEFQQMAKHPEVVQRVIEDALANGEVVTKSQVLKEIKAAKEQAKQEIDSDNRKMQEKLEAQELRVMQLESIKVKDEDEIRAVKQKAKDRAEKLEKEKSKRAKLENEIADLQAQIDELQLALDGQSEITDSESDIDTEPDYIDEISKIVGVAESRALMEASNKGKVIVIKNDHSGKLVAMLARVGIIAFEASEMYQVDVPERE